MSQPSPLSPVRQRAQGLVASGDPAGAIALLEHAVSLGKVNLGEDDPDVLAASHQLARVYQETDDPSSARRVLEEAYAAGQWRLGDSDPLMLEISYDLGVVAEELGNRHEARKAMSRVVELGGPVLGDFHWAVLRARAYLDGGETPEPVPDTPVQTLPPLQRRVPAYEQETTPPVYEQPAPQPAYEEPVYEQPAPEPVYEQPVYEQPAPEPVYERPVYERPTPQPRSFDDQTAMVHPIFHSPPVPDALYQEPQREDSRRGPALFAAIAAALAAIIAVAALVFVLADRGDDPPATDRPDVPTLGGGPPPTELRLRDLGTTVELSWLAPGEAKTSFLVTGGHPGEVLKTLGEVGPGQTSFRLEGLNNRLDYCFAVLAVYSTTEFASSAPACTKRPDPDPTE